jgi:hypothetical protein
LVSWLTRKRELCVALMAQLAGISASKIAGYVEDPEVTWVYVERVTRIELALSAWEADVLPLNYTRVAGQGPRGL